MSSSDSRFIRPTNLLPRARTLTAQAWGASAVFAGLRLAVNDSIRAHDRDQGEYGNLRNEIMGVVAELVGRDVIERYVADEDGVEGVLINFARPEDTVDLTFRDRQGQEQRLELKGHLRTPGYHLFTINERAHERSLAREATGYVGVLTTLGGVDAVVSRVIPTKDLEPSKKLDGDWHVKCLNDRNDPAYVIHLDKFRGRYTEGLDPTRKYLSPSIVKELEMIIKLARTKLRDVEGRTQLSPKATAQESKDWALSHLHRWQRHG